MKRILCFVLTLVVTNLMAQHHVESKAYAWRKPANKAGSVFSTPLFEGSARDMAFIQMSANALTSAQRVDLETPANEEQLLLVRSGLLSVTLGDSTWKLGKASVAVLLPAQKFSLQNVGSDSCTFFLLKYRSTLAKDNQRGAEAGGSFVKDPDKIVFKPHDKGGIRNYFERPTAMCRRLEMHVTTLNEGFKSHDPHTHRAEEIVLVIENKTEMQIGEQFYKGGPGTVYYLGSNVAHAIRNDGKGSCTYFAFQFE
jgi:(S)-ureidoglycine aminohydrolase